MVEFRLLRGDGASYRFVLRVMSDKGKCRARECSTFCGCVQHQSDPIGMRATAVSGFALPTACTPAKVSASAAFRGT
jgi:hypothetical protein